MIDINSEQIITLAEVPDHLPKLHDKRIPYQTIWLWAHHGKTVNGRPGERVCLEYLKINSLVTSVEAIHRFLAATNPQATPAAPETDSESVPRPLRLVSHPRTTARQGRPGGNTDETLKRFGVLA